MDIAVTTVRESVAAGELCNGPSKEEKQHLKSIPDYSLTKSFLTASSQCPSCFSEAKTQKRYSITLAFFGGSYTFREDVLHPPLPTYLGLRFKLRFVPSQPFLLSLDTLASIPNHQDEVKPAGFDCIADEVEFWLWMEIGPAVPLRLLCEENKYPLILASLKLQLIRTKKRYAKLLDTRWMRKKIS